MVKFELKLVIELTLLTERVNGCEGEAAWLWV